MSHQELITGPSEKMQCNVECAKQFSRRVSTGFAVFLAASLAKVHLSDANPLCREMEQIPPSRHVQPIYYHYYTTSGCLGHQQSATVRVLKTRRTQRKQCLRRAHVSTIGFYLLMFFIFIFNKCELTVA